MHLTNVLQSIGAVLAVVLSILYFYQIAYLFVPMIFRQRPAKNPKPMANRRFAILIAARNEQAVLPHLLDSIQGQDYPYITTYVVADNCTDETARVAREHGAIVYERFNKKQVGKGYALDYLLTQIQQDGHLDDYDAFMIFDADNLLSSNYFTEMNKTCDRGYEAFSGYRNTKNFATNWISAGYGIWYLHDAVHMNRSRCLLGATCAVNGTGFGFTRQLLEKMGGWKFFTLTEDIEFSMVCATHGYKVGYCHDAILYDEQPTKWSQSYRQRIRWSQGAFQVARLHSGELFRGIIHPKTAYSSIESMTLSVWGLGLGAVAGILSFINSFLDGGAGNAAAVFGVAALTTYLSMAGIAALTVLTEWKRIPATTGRKLFSILCFPLFMISWLPISMLSIFYKFQWTPIEHTVAISAQELKAGNTKTEKGEKTETLC